jgi:hypothetical protein
VMLIQRKSKQFGSLLVGAFDQDNEFDRPTMVEAVQILERVSKLNTPPIPRQNRATYFVTSFTKTITITLTLKRIVEITARCFIIMYKNSGLILCKGVYFHICYHFSRALAHLCKAVQC